MSCSVRQLSAQRGWVTRAINNANKVLAEVRAPLSSLQQERDTLSSRWHKYVTLWQTYEEIKLESDEDIQTESDTHCETEDLYNAVCLKLDIAIAQAQAIQNVGIGAASPVPPDTNKAPKYKMPDIKIPEFHGDPKTWNNFWDTFNALVHSKTDIPPVVKFTYLKDALHGIAKESIAGFQLKEADYLDAIQTLRDNFADPKKIKRKLIRHWIKLKEPKYNAKELLEFKIGVQTTLRSLSNYHELENFEFMAEEQIHVKLPIEASEYICRHFSTQYPTVSQLLEGLQILIEHLQHQAPKAQRETSNSSQNSQNRNQTKHVEPKPKNFVGSYSVTQRDRKCLFCHKSDHTSHECQTYSTVSKRRDRLSELNRCTKCIGVGHSYKECQAKFSPCRTCGKTNHHGLLCFQANKSIGQIKQVVNVVATKDSPNTEAKVSSVKEEKVEVSKQTTSLQVVSNNQMSAIALPTATAVVVNQDTQQKLECRVFFDQGSQKSFIASSVVKHLQLPAVEEVNLKIRTFQHQPVESHNTVVQPLLRIGKYSHLVTLIVVDILDTSIHSPGLVNTADHLSSRGISLADKHLNSDVVDNISIIIGSDYYSNYIKGFDRLHGVNLLNTSGGKVIYGPILPCLQDESSRQHSAMNVTVMRICNNYDSLSIVPLIEERTEEMHKLWDLETIGISPQETAPEDKYAYENFLESIQYHSGQYWVRLPWKPNPPSLPTNFRMALGQLYSLLSVLRRKVIYLEHYHKVINEQLQLQFIEKIPEKELDKQNCHYLPHHAVEKNSVTTPLRVVFNCSARAGKGCASLNDCLLTGPSLTKKLVDILTNFRLNKFAYTADISKAFLRVGLQHCDRDFTRFLWVEDVNQIPPKIVTYRFTSVLFGSTSSPFLLQATLTKHFQSSASPLKEILLKNFYMDNFQGSTNDETTLLQIFFEANKILAQANMPLQTWNSNNPQLQRLIEKTYPDYERPIQISILGISWNTDTDTFSVKKLEFPSYPNLTKRQLLSLVSRTFDPLGLVSPLTIRGKLLMQKAWSEDVSWDAPLDHTYHDEWKKLQSDLESVHTITFPRCVCVGSQNIQLHVFCDASSKAYGAVAYIVDESNSYLLTSRARVCPLLSRSIPQMELTALQVGAQLTTYILNTMSINFNHVILWSDNEAVLHWVCNQGSDIIYVKNRVDEIRRLSNNFKLYYVPSKMNPADLLSKGMNLNQLKRSFLWFHGPEWLSTNEWPSQKFSISVNEIIEDYTTPPPPIPIFDYINYSSLTKILNITTYVLKFLKLTIPSLNLMSAMQYWLRFSQRKHFNSIVSMLSHANLKGPNDSRYMINDLGLFLDGKGIIRCRGRIQNASLPFFSRYPILLPSKSHITTLLIEISHRTSLHEGISGTLAEVRSKFWIPKGRQTVKRVISRCNICQKVTGQPYRYPGPPPLPTERVNFITPFHTTGVDYTGAIQLSKTSSGYPEKYYICLFTCTATRAVHLELAKDLSAETFLLLFRKFCARKSLPSKLISDNGSNLKATQKFLQCLAQEPSVKEFFEAKQIQWHFIAPRAPWQGGFYERLISVVKGCLHKILYHRKVTPDELSTILTEVETRINNRPLTYLTDDMSNIESLTPSHLLYARKIQTMPLLTDDDDNDPTYMDGSELRMQYVKVSKIIQHFTKIWKREYLASLRERHYGAKAPVDQNCIKVGDLVLLQSDQSRNDWPLGRIVKIHTNPENTVRMVDVLSNGKVSLRTIEKLIPLEVDFEDSVSKETLIVDSGDLSSDSTLERDVFLVPKSTSQVPPSPRVRRQAANRAELLRKQLIANEQL